MRLPSNLSHTPTRLALLACLTSPLLLDCRGARNDEQLELTRSNLVSYPDEPDLPRAAITRLGNKNLYLDGSIRAMTLDPVERFLIASDGGRLEIFEPETGYKERAILPHIDRTQPSDMKQLVFAHSGKHLLGLTSEHARKLMVWSMPERSLLYSLPGSQVSSRFIATSATRPHFATITPAGSLVVRQLEDHEVVVETDLLLDPSVSEARQFTALYYTPDDTRLLLLRRDGWEVRDARSGEQLFHAKQRSTYVGAAFFPDGKRVAMVHGAGSRVEIWDLQKGDLIKSIDFARTVRRVSKIEVDPTTGTILVQTSGQNPTLLGLDEERGELFRIRSHDFAVSQEGLIAISLGRSIRRYRIDEEGTINIIERVAGHASAPTQFLWDDAGDTLWSASPEGTIIRWNLTEYTGAFLQVDLLPGHVAMALDRHSGGMAISSMVRTEDGPRPMLRWLDRDSGEVLWSTELTEPLAHLAILEEGDLLGVLPDGSVLRFNPYGSPIMRWPLGDAPSQAVNVNDDMTRLTIYEPHIKKARYWDLESGYLMGARRFPDTISCAWYKRYTVACTRDRGVGSVSLGSLWYPSSEVSAFSHGFQQIRGMRFSTLGDRLAIWGARPSRFQQSDQLWLFDATLGDDDPMLDPLVLEPDDGKIMSAAFHPDARRFVTGHDSGLIYLWDLGKAQAIELR